MHRSLLTTRIPGRLAAGHTAVFVHGWPDNSNVFAPLTGHDSPLLDRFASLLLCDLPLCDRRSWNPELLDFETLAALLASSEFFSTLRFLADNPAAIWDQVVISITSATGQLFIYFTIRKFGPVVFTIIMTTRQMFSMVLSTVAFGHALGPYSYIAALVVFGTIFYRIKRGGRG